MRRSTERGFTLVEIMIVVAIIALLSAIAIPNVLRGRTTANESAAIGNMRALISSLEMYRSVNNTYPGSTPALVLAQMYTTPDPDFGPPSFNRVWDQAEPASVVQGFAYLYASPAGGGTYTLVARPETPGTTGTRAFFANETGLLRHCGSVTDTATAAGMATDNTIDQGPTAACD